MEHKDIRVINFKSWDEVYKIAQELNCNEWLGDGGDVFENWYDNYMHEEKTVYGMKGKIEISDVGVFIFEYTSWSGRTINFYLDKHATHSDIYGGQNFKVIDLKKRRMLESIEEL